MLSKDSEKCERTFNSKSFTAFLNAHSPFSANILSESLPLFLKGNTSLPTRKSSLDTGYFFTPYGSNSLVGTPFKGDNAHFKLIHSHRLCRVTGNCSFSSPMLLSLRTPYALSFRSILRVLPTSSNGERHSICTN